VTCLENGFYGEGVYLNTAQYWLIFMKTKKTVVMLLYAYLYNDWRVLKEAKSLVTNNYNVTILCLLFQDESYDNYKNSYGIEVIPILKISYEKRKSFKGLMLFWYYCIKQMSIMTDIDVIHSHDLPGLIPGVFYKYMRRGMYLIFDSHEMFADAIYGLYGRYIYSIVQIVENVCIYNSDVYIGVVKSQIELTKKRIRNHNHINFYYIPNYPELSGIMKSNINHQKNNVFKIAYMGSMVKGRFYNELIDAIKLLVNNNHSIKLYIIGTGEMYNPIIKKIKREKLLKYVTMTGYLNQNEARRVASFSDVGIILVKESRNTVYLMPNKFFEYLQLGLGIISVHANGIGKYLDFVDAEITHRPVNANRIADSILAVMNDEDRRQRMIKKGQTMINQNWNWTTCEKTLIIAYNKLLYSSNH
jgi:glycosyltransferase involved in cell wall biosynthesis